MSTALISTVPVCMPSRHGKGKFTFTFHLLCWIVSSLVTIQIRRVTVRSSPNTVQTRDVITIRYMKQSLVQFVHMSQYIYRTSWPVYHHLNTRCVRRYIRKRL